MKLEGINWLYMGLSCAESMAVPGCLDCCCYLATESNDIYAGILMLIQGGKMPQNHKQVFFFTRVGWLSSWVYRPESGAIEAAAVAESASLFVVWWKESFCCCVTRQGKSNCADREDFRAL